MNKKNTRIKAIGLTLIMLCQLNAGSRLAFTRTSNMIKIPTTSPYQPRTLLTIGASAEMYKIDPQNQTGGLFFNTYLNPKFNIGISAISYADTSQYIEEDSTSFRAVNETGIHLQYTAYTKDDISIGVGIQDILIRRGQNIDQKGISLYAVFSSHRTFEDYELGSYLGFGSGKIAVDTGLDSVSTTESSSGVFLGFSLNTPYMKEHGGIDVMAEYDGSGLNIGIKIPITKEYKAMLGITHFENFGEFGTQSDELVAERLKTDAPAIAIGFAMTIPSKENKETLKKLGTTANLSISTGDEDPYLMLRDSLKYNKYQIKNLSEYNAQIEQQLKTLMDSTRKQELEKQVYKSNLNKTMRHLSKSLRHFYSGDYMIALQEVEIALQLNPELAIAYARRGTIFYKLGEQQKAIINWNLALQLDPVYEEVREILEAAKEGKLEALPKQKQPGGL